MLWKCKSTSFVVLTLWEVNFFCISIQRSHPHKNCRVSKYKFSKMISIHFLKKLVESIWVKIKDFCLCDHFINSHRLCSWQSMDFVRRKLILVTIGTERVKAHQLQPSQYEPAACNFCTPAVFQIRDRSWVNDLTKKASWPDRWHISVKLNITIKISSWSWWPLRWSAWSRAWKNY